jgi:type I restriction enzyme S subunit
MSERLQTKWPKVRLGDYASVKARLGWKGLKAEEYVADGPIFLATPNLRGGRIDFDNVDHITQWRFDESPEIQLREADVLLVKDGSTLGISSFVSCLHAPTTVNGSIAVIRANSPLDGNYLFYCINGLEFQKLIWLKRAGLGVPHLFQADLREFQIFLPSAKEQRRISEILSTIDETIAQTEALIAKLQQIKAGLMHDLFTRGVTPDGKLRPPREEAPELYQQSPLGWIPKEWTISSCAAEFTINSGITLGPHRRPQKRPHPYLRVANVRREQLVLNEIATLEASNIEALDYGLKTFDLLVVEGHANRSEIGRCAMVYNDAEGMLFQNHLFRLRTVSMNNHFALMWLNSFHAQRYWESQCSTSSGLNTINRTLLSRLPVLVPKRQEQERIAETASTLGLRLKMEHSYAKKMQQQRHGLMQDLLTGNLDHLRTDGCRS